MRIGMGYDIHRLVKGRPLMLGCVKIPFSLGLDGHSDADVLAHAVADAVLGAAGERHGLDRLLRANTERKKRTHSLYQQGKQYFMQQVCAITEKMRFVFECLLYEMKHITDFAWII